MADFSIMRWRLGTLSLEKLIWYSVFQTIGGLVAVYLMKFLMGIILTEPPVKYVVRVPGKNISDFQAALMETTTAFLMIAMVLFISDTTFRKRFLIYLHCWWESTFLLQVRFRVLD